MEEPPCVLVLVLPYCGISFGEYRPEADDLEPEPTPAPIAEEDVEEYDIEEVVEKEEEVPELAVDSL